MYHEFVSLRTWIVEFKIFVSRDLYFIFTEVSRVRAYRMQGQEKASTMCQPRTHVNAHGISKNRHPLDNTAGKPVLKVTLPALLRHDSVLPVHCPPNGTTTRASGIVLTDISVL